jgi:hypothetical protein
MNKCLEDNNNYDINHYKYKFFDSVHIGDFILENDKYIEKEE